MKKILITGVTGFVGRNLINYLKSHGEYKITGVSRDRLRLSQLSHFLENEITYDDLFKCKDSYDIIIHLAGKVIKRGGEHKEDDYYEANYILTKKVYDYFLRSSSPGKFLFLSSIHVLTDKPNTTITESFQAVPFTDYGRSKYLAEQYINDHVRGGKQAYILRPTMIHGPGNKGNLKSLFNYLMNGWPYLLGKVDNERSFLSEENLNFILKEIIDRDIEPGLYHLSDDEPTHTYFIINTISELTGKRVRVLNIPLSLIQFIAKIGNKLPVPFNEQRFAKLTTNFVVSNDKIKKAINKPLPIKADDGMIQTITSFIKESAQE